MMNEETMDKMIKYAKDNITRGNVKFDLYFYKTGSNKIQKQMNDSFPVMLWLIEDMTATEKKARQYSVMVGDIISLTVSVDDIVTLELPSGEFTSIHKFLPLMDKLLGVIEKWKEYELHLCCDGDDIGTLINTNYDISTRAYRWSRI